ncbi:hypothetical protein F0U59_23420 [Archangium gephyra]|nr:hypothetical protein F0U59_23420 [Archangium gephyra]
MAKSKLKKVYEIPEISVHIDLIGQIAITQEAGMQTEEQNVYIDRARVELLIDMLRAVAKEYDENPPSPFVDADAPPKQKP